MLLPFLFVCLNIIAFFVRRSPYLMNAVLGKIGNVPQAHIESKEEDFEKINPEEKSSLILVNHKDDDQWRHFSDWLQEGSTIMYEILKKFLFNYYPHIVAVIAILLLVYVLRKKGRPAYNPIRLFTVWFETKKCDRAETYACQYNKKDWKSLLFMLMDQQLLSEIQLEQSMNYDEVKMVLNGRFKNHQNVRTEPNIVAAMDNFTKCFKGREESCDEFLSRFLSFAEKAEINKESTLVSYFINNLQNKQMEQFIRQSV
ncbi:hypothetical protein BpHYR1_049097, partial [Brachionus plicatilis]